MNHKLDKILTQNPATKESRVRRGFKSQPEGVQPYHHFSPQESKLFIMNFSSSLISDLKLAFLEMFKNVLRNSCGRALFLIDSGLVTAAGFRTHNQLFHKRTLNHLAKLANLVD